MDRMKHGEPIFSSAQQEPYRPSHVTVQIVSVWSASGIQAIHWISEICNDASGLTPHFHALALNPFGCIEIDSTCISSDAGLLRTFILHPS